MHDSARFRRLIERHGHYGTDGCPIPDLMVMSSFTPTMPLAHIAAPSLAVVAQGAKRSVVGDLSFDYAAGQFQVISVELPFTSHVTVASRERPFLGMGIRLRASVIAELMLEMAPASETDRPAPESPRGIAVNELTPELLDALERLLALLDAPADAAALAGLYEREIVWRLLNGPQGRMVRQIGLVDSRLAHVARAIGWIRGHYAEPIRVEELAALASMSPSSFHRHFRAVTTLTPIQFQKQIRLQRARALLLADPGAVATVGYGVGYASASQFSREYRRLFGAPPGRDSQALRAVV
jgi:AraC-like DNA-binding protein